MTEIPSEEDLRLLIDDAARRAAGMLAGFAAWQPGDALTDAVRMLAAPGGIDRLAVTAARAGLAEEELRRLVLAYRHGGEAGVGASLALYPVPYDRLDDAVRQIRVQRVFAAEALEPDAFGVTDPSARVQVRWGPDGRWYPFTFSRERWWPAPGAAENAGQAYRAAMQARRSR